MLKPNRRSTSLRRLRSHPAGTIGLYWSWLRGLVSRRTGSLAATAVGVALAVGLLASLGSFLSSSKATMTRRATETVAVDWQVETQAGANPAAVAKQVASTRHVVASEVVPFATTGGFQSTTGGATQTTGPGQVLGIDSTYTTNFPAQLRPLVGATKGVLLFQQTAANLDAAPGDVVSIARAGLSPVSVKIDGIVDIPQADSLFQKVGAPVGGSGSGTPRQRAPPAHRSVAPTVRPPSHRAARPG